MPENFLQKIGPTQIRISNQASTKFQNCKILGKFDTGVMSYDRTYKNRDYFFLYIQDVGRRGGGLKLHQVITW